MAFALLLLMGARSAAEPVNACPVAPCHLRMRAPSTLTTVSGDEYVLPPGRFLDESTFIVLDDELRRLQDQETRLKAENQSLRDSLAGWQPGWMTIAVTLVLGAAAGVGAYYWVEHR